MNFVLLHVSYHSIIQNFNHNIKYIYIHCVLMNPSLHRPHYKLKTFWKVIMLFTFRELFGYDFIFENFEFMQCFIFVYLKCVKFKQEIQMYVYFPYIIMLTLCVVIAIFHMKTRTTETPPTENIQ